MLDITLRMLRLKRPDSLITLCGLDACQKSHVNVRADKSGPFEMCESGMRARTRLEGQC